MTLKTKNNNDNEPATKADVARVADDVDSLAIATKNAFARIEAKMVTKEDVSVIKKDLSGLKKDVSGLKKDVSGLKKGQVSLKEGQAGLKEGQERILSIVESIDDHFKEHKDLPRKVEELEVDVFKLKTRQR